MKPCLRRPLAGLASMALLALLLLLLLVAACGDDDGDSAPSETVTPTAVESAEPSGSVVGTPEASRSPAECTDEDRQQGLIVRLNVGADGLFQPGEPVVVTFSLINCGDADTVLYYPTAQRYDFFIEQMDGETTGAEVWSADDDISFEQVEGTETIKPDEIVSYTETWDQLDRDGVQVPPGRYKISTFSVGCGAESQENCTFGSVRQIEIQPGAES